MTRWWVVAFAIFLVPAVSAQRIRLPESFRTLEERAQRDSNDAAAHFNVALAYWNEERWEDCRAAFRTAVTIDPQFAAAWLGLAMLPFAQRPGLWEDLARDRIPEEWVDPLRESDRLYRRAMMIDPFVDYRVFGAASPPRSAWWTQNELYERVYDFLFRGFDDFERGRYQDAHGRFSEYLREIDADRFVDRAPNAILYYHGLAAGHLERWDDAIYDFEVLMGREQEEEEEDRILHLPLRTNEFRYILAVVRHRSGQLADAAGLYREALGHDVGLYMANVQLARLHEAQGLWVEAIRERQHAINANPEDGSLVYDLGITLARAGRWSDAAATLAQAAVMNPRDARVPYYRGIIASRLGFPVEARIHLEHFLAIAPSRYADQMADARRRIDALR